MTKRLLVGIPLTLLIGALVALDGYLAQHIVAGAGFWLRNGLISTALVGLFVLLGTDELVYLARGRGYRPFRGAALCFSVWLAVSPYLAVNLAGAGRVTPWLYFSVAVALGWLFVVQAVRRRTERALESIAVTLLIILYLGGLASFMTALRMQVGGSSGAAALLLSVFVVKMTDTGAYFTGRALGRHKFIQWLSPKKTWEGFAGGLAAAIVLAVGIGHWLYAANILRPEISAGNYTWILIMLGLVLGLASVAGDLAESLLKRDAEIKDSGRVPGLGGVLDMLDSLLLSAPMAWLFWTLLFQLHA